MKKYIVEGTAVVTVRKEVWANSEDEALDKAYEQLSELNEYCGNGGCDSLVGVENEGESVAVFDSINYNDVTELEDNPDYFECPNCGEVCQRNIDTDDVEYWYCTSCCYAFDDDGNEFYPAEDWEEDEE